MILLIDNYDSFSYNLVQMIGSIRPDIRVVRNDRITIASYGILFRSITGRYLNFTEKVTGIDQDHLFPAV